MVICLERDADLHVAQLMPLPLTVSCFSKIQIGFTILVPAHLGSPGQRAVKRVCVCMCVCVWERPVIEFSESIWTIWAFLELGKYGTYAFLVMSITMSLCVCMCVCVCVCAEHSTVESYTIIISLQSYLLSYLLLLVFHHPLSLSLLA